MRFSFFTLALAAFILLQSPSQSFAVCSSPAGVAGEALYNADYKEMQYCDNTNWVSMGRGPETGPGCSSPAGTAGHMMFNKDYGVMQYCNGHEWVQMGTAGGEWDTIGSMSSSSSAHTCGIKNDGTLWCWGQGQFGRLGDNTATTRYVPTAVSGGGTWKQIGGDGTTTCGIKSDDTLWCWGYNSYGEVGDGSQTDRWLPTAISGGGTWKQVTGGTHYSCGIKMDDTLWCWGKNVHGQFGNGTTTDSLVPVAGGSGWTWKQVDATTGAGGYTACGIKMDDTLWCWGYNAYGQVGDNTTTGPRLNPTAVNGGGTWKQVSTGGNNTCGIKSDDTLWCWGTNVDGQVGDNSTTQRNIPTAVFGGGTWKKVSAGGSHTCGIKTDDSIWCWGRNDEGQIGDGTNGVDRLVPAAVSMGGTWKQIEASGNSGFTCGVRTDDTLLCWGGSYFGDNSNPFSAYVTLPTAINGGGAWKQVSAGGVANSSVHTCGIKTDDTTWCWGSNANGQIGDNSTIQRLIPTAINGGGTWKQVSAGQVHTCGIKLSGDSLWCWGANSSGQIGDNTSGTNRLIPTAISGGGTWKQVSAGGGGAHTCGIKLSDDSLWCWGANSSGQIGDNTSGTNRLIPTAISGGGTWKQVSVGNANTCGIKMDDTLWCWGWNPNGQIGDNTSGTNRLIPTAVSGGGTWKQVVVQRYHTCAIKSDDTLWCWGSNGNGKTGLNTTVGDTLVPTAVNGGGTWKQVSTGDLHTCGIKTADTLWCWGRNLEGQIGDGTTTQRLVPTVVGDTWKLVSAGNNYTCGIKTADTLWCWGDNSTGQLTATDDSAPFRTSGVRPWCVNPLAKPGTVLYNADFAILQYCGGRWMGIGK